MVLNKDIFLGAGTSLTFIPECDLYLGVGRQDDDSAFPTNGSLTTNEVKASSGFLTNFSLLEDLYIGCLIERYTGADDTLASVHRIKSNTATTITTTHSFKPHADDYFVIRAYGAPTPSTTSTAKRLLSDQWLGVLESATFPTVEPDFKQVNLSLGGSRNFTYQYKGITNFGTADLNLVANHGAWLYYFLGRCTSLICSTEAVGSSITDRFTAGESNKVLIEGLDASGTNVPVGAGKTLASFTETGPIFYRSVGTDICPPLADNEIANITNMDVLTRPSISSGSITNPITYTFAESDSDNLPSFAIERSDSKLAATTPFRTDTTSISITGGSTTSGDTTITFTDNANSALMQVGMLISGTGIPAHTRIAQIVSGVRAELTNNATATGSSLTFTLTEDEDNSFVQIARGCRVNTLTMTANENEEVKMTLSLNTRNVHSPKEGEQYDARSAVSNEKDFFNFEAETTGANAAQEFREPFFFSDGTFKVLGQEFLKINTLTLTMNNNLQDRRFLGVGSKEVQEAIPAQRNYEISFTGHVTDNALYKALRDDTENITQTIELIFTKPNGEAITLNFTDYMVSSNNFPIADDKGPIAVEATVMPRNLSLCTVKTHWVLQG
tara:strand:- start:13271 stop:15112 length:1842 start_codon:yes stop_codon:yes gene_type:complete